jgi:hypothetical protein
MYYHVLLTTILLTIPFQTATKSNIDWLDRPPASLVVEGQLRPAFAEESTMVAKHLSSSHRDKPGNQHYILQISTFYRNMGILYRFLNLVQVTSHRKIKRRAVPLSSRLRSSALS